MFDSDYRQRNDIEDIKDQLEHQPNPAITILPLQKRVDRLELVIQTLAEILIAKKVCTQAEIDVLMLQIDLRDGLEDGQVSQELRAHAPHCNHCNRFINPRRTTCVYCGTPIHATQNQAKLVKLVDCGGCDAQIPENESYFTVGGVRCYTCYEQDPGDF